MSSKIPKNRKRQFGTERDTTPLSKIHDIPSNSKIAFNRLFIVLTVFFWLVYVISVFYRQYFEIQDSFQFRIESFFYLGVVTFLIFSALMYLIARQGALEIFGNHVRVPRAVLDDHFSRLKSTITVLVPSYDEEPAVVRKTLLSAALQEFPDIHVVLLIDDNGAKLRGEARKKYLNTLNLISEINELLEEPHDYISKVLKRFKAGQKKKYITNKGVFEIAEHYKWASSWLKEFAEHFKIDDHTDIFFTEHVLKDMADDLQNVSDALLISRKKGAKITTKRGIELYVRIVRIFNAKLSYFERKKYSSLSKELNKAMNLNSYIGLMGDKYKQEVTPDGIVLVKTSDRKHYDMNIPDSEYLLTLDADSVLLPEYCIRLVYLLEQPDNSDVGVTQTPYSSFRGAPTRIERLAGATTDIQHIIHQGMSYHGAAFWVGANAVIRKKALRSIEEREWIGGFEIKRYIQDRTVIEDTESSIDLAEKGWRLINYPERLSYSATPPDFGSLIVQRRRWANGGLLINPKLFSYIKLRKQNRNPVPLVEVFLRLNYMASIAWSNFGLVFLLAYPYDGRLLSPFVLLAALPYFIAMASDLNYCRYKFMDIFRIYGFNLILLPVNLAGTIKSLQQGLTTRKIPFARTPKIKNRTSAGILFIISPLFIIAFSILTFVRNYENQIWGNAVFALFNAVSATWALFAYIGIRSMIEDLWLGFINFLYVEKKNKSSKTKEINRKNLNWEAVLYHGDNEGHVPFDSFTDLGFTSDIAQNEK